MALTVGITMMPQELNTEDFIWSYKVGVCLPFYCHSGYSGNFPEVTQLVMCQGQDVSAHLPDSKPMPLLLHHEPPQVQYFTSYSSLHPSLPCPPLLLPRPHVSAVPTLFMSQRQVKRRGTITHKTVPGLLTKNKMQTLQQRNPVLFFL